MSSNILQAVQAAIEAYRSEKTLEVTGSLEVTATLEVSFTIEDATHNIDYTPVVMVVEHSDDPVHIEVMEEKLEDLPYDRDVRDLFQEAATDHLQTYGSEDVLNIIQAGDHDYLEVMDIDVRDSEIESIGHG